MFKSIRQIISILDPASRRRFAILLIPMMTMLVLEVVSIGLILPVIQILLLGETDGEITRLIISVVPKMTPKELGFLVAGIFAIFFIFKNIILFAIIYTINRTINNTIALYTKHLFHIYISKSLIFHFKNNSAELLRNITAGIALTLEAGRLALMMLLDAMLMFGAAALLILVEPHATLVATLLIGIVGLLFYRITSPIFKNWGKQSMLLEGSLIKWVNQSLTGIRDVKLIQAHQFLGAKIGDVAYAHAKFASRSVSAIHIPRLLIETIVVVGFLGIVSLLLSMEHSSGSVVSILGLFGMAALRIMPSLNRLLASASEIRRRDSYIETIHKAFSSQDSNSVNSSSASQIEALSFQKNITIEDITYAYPDAEHHALKQFNLNIKRGETIGFVGQSGAGKSTLMDIILGLLEPTSGQLLVDGKNAYDNISGWQKNIGFVPQQVFVMDDTIRRNIAFAINDDDIDDTRIKTVLELTQLDKFVGELPEGLDTLLGEHGARLSGGQRQRIAISRALYRNPDILVFDEATSALDNVTEQKISRAIETLSGDKTILIVAHRLSTVRNCDKIVFMKEGGIEIVGPYDQLLVDNDEFRHLAELGNSTRAKKQDTSS